METISTRADKLSYCRLQISLTSAYMDHSLNHDICFSWWLTRAIKSRRKSLQKNEWKNCHANIGYKKMGMNGISWQNNGVFWLLLEQFHQNWNTRSPPAGLEDRCLLALDNIHKAFWAICIIKQLTNHCLCTADLLNNSL